MCAPPPPAQESVLRKDQSFKPVLCSHLAASHWTEAIASAFDGVASDLSEKLASGKDPHESLSSFIAQYLSTTHRDTKSGGCPAPALSGDAARNGKTVQTSFVKGIETYLDIIAAQIGGDEQEARQQAIALFRGLMGAMMLSRAVKKSDPALSDELLSATRKMLKLKK
jgi:TetR/AcrR family transcriptional regulator, transcriptional repressor for nem operon